MAFCTVEMKLSEKVKVFMAGTGGYWTLALIAAGFYLSVYMRGRLASSTGQGDQFLHEMSPYISAFLFQ